MYADSNSVEISGVKELQRALRGCEKKTVFELRRRLKPAGDVIAEEIRKNTPVSRGTGRRGTGGRSYTKNTAKHGFDLNTRTVRVRPGLLRKSTKVKTSPSRLTVRVYNDARKPWNRAHLGERSGGRRPRYEAMYRYGKRIEFDPKYRGSKAWFYPSVERKREEAVRVFRSAVDEIAKEFSKG